MQYRLTRRNLLQAAAAGVAASTFSIARAADSIKVAIFNPDSGPAALFGPAGRAAAELGADAVNAKGGILGRKIELIFADAGVSPAEATKSAMGLMLRDKVDLVIGSHDGAVRQALQAAIKGKVPYIFTPVHEGADCTANTFYIGETPEQQIGPALPKLMEIAKGKSVYLIGNDYVWPQTVNAYAKTLIASLGGTVVGEEYFPLGAANKFENSVQKIKSAAPAIVLQTLVGGDNVNFNRTFSDFGLSSSALRFSCLLEENTLAGIGASASQNLYACMDYFANIDSPENKAFLAAQKAKFGADAPQQGTISAGLYSGIMMAAAVAAKAGSLSVSKFSAAAEGVTFETPGGKMTVHNRHANKTMYLANCNGGTFSVIEAFANVETAQTCS